MGQWEIRPQVYEELFLHVQMSEEKYSQWIHDHFPQLSPERECLVSLLETYIEEMKAFLKSVKQVEGCDDELPFVTMCSEVKVANQLSNRQQHLIVLPFYEERVKNHHISILSPMGSSLLLKSKGAIVTIKAPRGDIDCEVVSIRYPGARQYSEKI